MHYCRNCGSHFQEADKFCETCRKTSSGASPKASFIGKTCPYCQFPIKQDLDVVVCAECCIPHHRECGRENGGCTTFGHQGLKRAAEPEPATGKALQTKNQEQVALEAYDKTYTTIVDLQCPVEVASVKIDPLREQKNV